MPLTSSGDYWNGLRDTLTSVAVDVARAKLIDVETNDTDKNIRDSTDVKLGEGATIGGLSILGWVGIAAVIVLGVVLVKRVL